MKIVKASIENIDEIMLTFEKARMFMKENNNDQWGDTYPEKEMIINDLDKMYICMEKDQIACVFYYAIEEDEDYGEINGAWLNSEPYGVIHRIATTGIVKGAAQFSLDWAFQQAKNIRIDTYEANIPMQKLLTKCGFQYCGTIYRIGMDWLAYQKV